MEFGGASSLVLLLAVALWLAYVIPSLVRRRNYLATERNAVRLQQALRALAETAETPQELRVSTTSRSVAEQQRRLKQARRAAEQAERERERVAERALPAVEAPRSDADRRRQAAATRRGRLATTIVGLFGLAGAGVGTWFGLTFGMWWLLVGGVVAVLGAVAMLQRLSRVAAAQRLAAERRAADLAAEASLATADDAAARARALAETQRLDVRAQLVDLAAEQAAPAAASHVAAEPVAGWTPIAVPKPLYLMRESADGSGPSGPDGPGGGHRPMQVDIEALRAAARRSEQALRDAHNQPGVATFGRSAVASAEGSPQAIVAVPAADSSAFAGSDADTQPFERAAIAEAVRIEPIQAPAGRLAARPSKWASMGVVAEASEVESPLARRRRAS